MMMIFPMSFFLTTSPFLLSDLGGPFFLLPSEEIMSTPEVL